MIGIKKSPEGLMNYFDLLLHPMIKVQDLPLTISVFFLKFIKINNYQINPFLHIL